MNRQIGKKIQYSPLINNKPVSGRYMITPFHNNLGVSATQTNTQIVFTPIWIAKPTPINALFFVVTTGAAGEKAVLGIYNESSSGGIGTLVKKSAEITLTASGNVTYKGEIEQTILPTGKYWLAINREGTTAVARGCSNNPLVWSTISYIGSSSLMASRNSFPAYTYTYNGSLPSDLSSVDMQTAIGVVAVATSLGVKVA